MPRTEKIARVAELKQRIEGSSALLLAEYRGLTVTEITELRRSLHEADAKFAVIKNTLMTRAAAEAGIEDLAPYFTGPSAVQSTVTESGRIDRRAAATGSRPAVCRTALQYHG